MKQVSLIILFIFGLLFSGCAMKPYIPEDNASKDEKGIITIQVMKNNNIFKEDNNKPYKDKYYRGNNDLIKRSLIFAAKETLKQNKNNFIILNKEMNHLNGFNLITYSDIKEFCLKKDREPNKIKINCESFIASRTGAGNLKIFPIDNTDYRIFSVDAKKIIEEINKEPIQ